MAKLIWICMVFLAIAVFFLLYCCIKVAAEADRKMQHMLEMSQNDRKTKINKTENYLHLTKESAKIFFSVI